MDSAPLHGFISYYNMSYFLPRKVHSVESIHTVEIPIKYKLEATQHISKQYLDLFEKIIISIFVSAIFRANYRSHYSVPVIDSIHSLCKFIPKYLVTTNIFIIFENRTLVNSVESVDIIIYRDS